jgi:anti-anti-sigma factor
MSGLSDMGSAASRPEIHPAVTIGHLYSRDMHDRELTYTTLDGPSENHLILQLDGPVTLSNLFGFQDFLRSLKPSTLIIDMTNVPYMDSAGLGLILNYYVSAERAQRQLALVAVSERIMTLFEVTKVNTVLTIFPTLEAFTNSTPR